MLSPQVTRLLSADQRVFSEVHFQINGGANIVQFGIAAEMLPPLTVGYLLSLPVAVRGGARLLAAFGMGGYQTLLWAHLLRHQPGLLQEFVCSNFSRLLMGTFVSPEAQLPYPYLNYCPEELQYQEIVDIAF